MRRSAISSGICGPSFSAFELNESDVEKNPLRQFCEVDGAGTRKRVNEPNAMTLATVNKETAGCTHRPASRCRQDRFTFFTNYQSRKGTQMADNKQACLNFFWPELQRQVRMLGTIES